MAASLPTESAAGKAVREFGLGPYDSDETGPRGEDDEDERSERGSRGQSLPDAGGSSIPSPEQFQSYPGTTASEQVVTPDGDVMGIDAFIRAMADRILRASASLPGDNEDSSGHGHPGHGHLDSPVPSVAKSELPSDKNNPSARSDYYDRMTVGLTGDEWADEDSGAYACSELPGAAENDVDSDNGLGAWNGKTIQDQSDPPGHPSPDYKIATGASMRKTATNLELVGQLAKDFLKGFGRKDLTRRHVMAFLAAAGQHQYMASDVIRCLKLRHNVHIKDVLDEFPVVKTASAVSLATVRDLVIEMEVENLRRPEVAYQLRRCAATLSDIIADLEKLEGRNG